MEIRTGIAKYPPQTDEQMTVELARKKNNKLYKVQADEHRSDVLSALVKKRAMELDAATQLNRISLSDYEAVRQQTMLYFSACVETGSVPSFLGLCRSLGYSRRALYDLLSKRHYPQTAEFIEMVRDTMSDILSESALTNNVNPTFAIFIQKAVYEWRENAVVDDEKKDPLTEAVDPVALAEKYKGYIIE